MTGVQTCALPISRKKKISANSSSPTCPDRKPPRPYFNASEVSRRNRWTDLSHTYLFFSLFLLRFSPESDHKSLRRFFLGGGVLCFCVLVFLCFCDTLLLAFRVNVYRTLTRADEYQPSSTFINPHQHLSTSSTSSTLMLAIKLRPFK